MRDVTLWALIVVTFLATSSCDPNQRVHADSDDRSEANPGTRTAINGDLYQVDVEAKTIVIRVANGMIQTFRWDPTTIVDGTLPSEGAGSASAEFDTSDVMQQLVRRRGSELKVEWRDVNDEKFATAVHVIALKPLTRLRHKKSTKRR